MDYYAYWNGATMAQFFQYVAAIVGSNDFNGLLKALGIIGMLVATCGAAFRMQGMEVGKWIFALALFQSLLLVPKVTVRVWDVRAGTSVNVSNVPIGLGVFASELSHIGKYLTDTYETLFTTPGDVSKFSKFGLAGPQRFARAAARAIAATPDTRLTLDAFINQCVIPEVADYPSKVQTIRDSTQLWALITNTTAPTFLNPARLVTLPIDAVTVTCIGAVAYLNARMTGDATALLKAVGVNAMPDQLGSATDLNNTNLAATVSAAIGASDTILTGASRAAQDILKDAVMFNQLKVAAGDATDGPMTSWAVSQANMASEINYSTMARIAETALPNLRSGIEGVIIAVFPIMILVVVLTGHNGGMALKSYIFMAAWIQLWPPLYAVVNSLALARDGSAYPTAVAALGGTTPAAMAWIAEMGASSQSTAGMFALSVPVIALAIIKGGEQAFSSMASSVLSPATAAAQSQGATLASGNVSAGNVSWGNTTAGNTSRNVVSEGNVSTGQRTGGQRTDMTSGFEGGNRGAWQHGGAAARVGSDGFGGGGVTAVTPDSFGNYRAGTSTSGGLSNTGSSSSGIRLTEERRAGLSSDLTAALDSARSTGTTAQDSTSSSTSKGYDVGAGRTSGAGETLRTGDSTSARADASNVRSESMSGGFGFNIGGTSGASQDKVAPGGQSGPVGNGSGVGPMRQSRGVQAGGRVAFGIDGQVTDAAQDAANRALSGDRSKDTASRLESSIRALDSISTSAGESSTRDQATRLASSLRNIQSATFGHSVASTETTEAGDSRQLNRGSSVSSEASLAGPIKTAGAQAFGSPMGFAMALASGDPRAAAIVAGAAAQAAAPANLQSAGGAAGPAPLDLPVDPNRVANAGTTAIHDLRPHNAGKVQGARGSNDRAVDNATPAMRPVSQQAAAAVDAALPQVNKEMSGQSQVVRASQTANAVANAVSQGMQQGINHGGPSQGAADLSYALMGSHDRYTATDLAQRASEVMPQLSPAGVAAAERIGAAGARGRNVDPGDAKLLASEIEAVRDKTGSDLPPHDTGIFKK